MTAQSMLVAGLGNIFHGDDGFGVEVINELRRRTLPPAVRVLDIGTRSIDLIYALERGWELAILVDATRRGRAPGSLYVLDLDSVEQSTAPAAWPGDAHGLHPEAAVQSAREAGARIETLRLVGCEPTQRSGDEELALGLSAPVRAAVPRAVRLVEELLTSRMESTGA